MNVIVYTEDAIKQLSEFKEQHEKDFKLHLEAWKLKHIEYQEKLNEWRDATDKFVSKPVEPMKPENHIKEYERLINKLRWHTQDEIELQDHEYSQIFENQFYWTHSFYNTTAISAASITTGNISANTIRTANISADSLEYANSRLESMGYKKVDEE